MEVRRQLDRVYILAPGKLTQEHHKFKAWLGCIVRFYKWRGREGEREGQRDGGTERGERGYSRL